MSQSTRHEASAIALQRECDDAKARVRILEGELEATRERERASRLHSSLAVSKADRFEASPAASDTQALSVGNMAEGSEADLRASIHALGLAVAMMSRRTAESQIADRGDEAR
jgi:hypothetical protein